MKIPTDTKIDKPQPSKRRGSKPIRLPDGHERMTIPELLMKMEAKSVDANQLAGVLGVKPKTIYRNHEKGSLPGFRVGTALRFDCVRIARLMEEGLEAK